MFFSWILSKYVEKGFNLTYGTITNIYETEILTNDPAVQWPVTYHSLSQFYAFTNYFPQVQEGNLVSANVLHPSLLPAPTPSLLQPSLQPQTLPCKMEYYK